MEANKKIFGKQPLLDVSNAILHTTMLELILTQKSTIISAFI